MLAIHHDKRVSGEVQLTYLRVVYKKGSGLGEVGTEGGVGGEWQGGGGGERVMGGGGKEQQQENGGDAYAIYP